MIKSFAKVKNVGVYGLENSILASGYPMSTGVPETLYSPNMSKKDFNRAVKLGHRDIGSGHDCFLKGITVQFDWTISQNIFMQVERYHFIDIISSQSKMHKLHMATRNDFNDDVDPIILDRFMELLDAYNNYNYGDSEFGDATAKEDLFNKLVYSCPMGYELTARFTTNYLQLKTIHKQRKNHRLDEWKDFCRWIETLPHFKELCLWG